MSAVPEDIRDPLDREAQDNIDLGMTAEKVRRQALLKFGNVVLAREDARIV